MFIFLLRICLIARIANGEQSLISPAARSASASSASRSGTSNELEQRILLETFSFAFGGTFVVTFSYGLMEGGADFPHLNWMWVWPVMAALWIVGGQLARRRYR